MNGDVLIATGMIAAVLGVAGWAIVLDWRDDRKRVLLAAMEAVRRAEWEQERAALAGSREAWEAREADRVTLAPGEERLLEEIGRRVDAGFPLDIAERVRKQIGRGTDGQHH